MRSLCKEGMLIPFKNIQPPPSFVPQDDYGLKALKIKIFLK